MTKDREVPEKVLACIPWRKQRGVLGTLCHQVLEMDRQKEEHVDDFDHVAHEKWKKEEESGERSTLKDMQMIGKRKIDDMFVGEKIEYLTEFEILDDGGQDLRWCTGEVENVCDWKLDTDCTWVVPGDRTNFYKKDKHIV